MTERRAERRKGTDGYRVLTEVSINLNALCGRGTTELGADRADGAGSNSGESGCGEGGQH